MEKVEKTSTCWLWTGVTSGSGARYGYFRPGGTAPKVPAHRWAYEYFVGPIPEGLEVDHVAERGCTSKLCVNPAHLEPVTHKINRQRGRLRTCRSGRHDLTNPDNVRWDSEGNRRGCIVCHREKALARHHRIKGGQ